MLVTALILSALALLGELLLLAVVIGLAYLTNEKLMHLQKQLNETTTFANNAAAAAKSAADLAQRAIDLVPVIRQVPPHPISREAPLSIPSPDTATFPGEARVYAGDETL